MRQVIGIGILSLFLIGAGEADDEEAEEAEASQAADDEGADEDEAEEEAPKPKAKAQPGGPASAPAAAPAQDAMKKAQSLEYQLAAWKVISATAPVIDRCTERYVEEFPGSKGSVALKLEIEEDGRVKGPEASTTLQGARNLTTCVRDVAKSWRFPPLGTVKVKTSLSIQVGKGLKFVMRKPGDNTPPAPGQPPKTEGFLRFAPSFGEWGEDN